MLQFFRRISSVSSVRGFSRLAIGDCHAHAEPRPPPRPRGATPPSTPTWSHAHPLRAHLTRRPYLLLACLICCTSWPHSISAFARLPLLCSRFYLLRNTFFSVLSACLISLPRNTSTDFIAIKSVGQSNKTEVTDWVRF
jgi:hypothetical protein